VATWHEIEAAVKEAGGDATGLRRGCLERLRRASGRNVVSYYAGWLQKPKLASAAPALFAVDDGDKTGLMSVLRGLDPGRGLDLVLHTPGGDTTATESIIAYLRTVFGTDIRAIVPQIAMSAGTMIACVGREIVMGPYSNLGPFDPQLGGSLPAAAVVEEFGRARRDIAADPSSAALWQPILAQYGIGLVSRAERALEMATEIVQASLETGMFAGRPDAAARAAAVVEALGSYALTKTHGRHIERNAAREIGLVVADLETDAEIESTVLSLHYACLLTFATGPAVKLIENHAGVTYVETHGA